MTLEIARELRDEAMRQAEQAALEAWKKKALQVIKLLAETNEYLIADDIWEFIKRPKEPRVVGPMMTKAHKAGWIEPMEDWIQNPDPKSHAAPVRRWKSLIWEAE